MVVKLNFRFYFFLRKLKNFLLLVLFYNLFLLFLFEVILNSKVGFIFCVDLWIKIDLYGIIFFFCIDYCIVCFGILS